MQNPPNLQIAHIVNFIAGASPAYVTQLIVAAPGANLRLRIWSFGTSSITGVIAGAVWHAYWRPTDDSWRIPVSSARESASFEYRFPGGILLPNNIGWEISATQTGAGSRTMPTWTAYTIEATA